MKQLVFTVTNDLNYDQRMIRICHSLQQAGYDVELVGRRHSDSPELIGQSFSQKRLFCFFRKGKLFYAEYNLRLFLYLLFCPMDLICAIDLDTILPYYLASVIRRKKRVYDAHELFCEMKEIVSRPAIYKVWKWVERLTVPRFTKGYTVCEPIREVFRETYGVRYEVIRNLPVLKPAPHAADIAEERFIIYQGTVNEGRSFETLIPAFQFIDCPLWIFGEGNFYAQCQSLIERYGLQEKVFLKGKQAPAALRDITPQAVLGITLFENTGLSNYYSLANRFFDYIHAGIPQLTVDYPSYRAINEQHKVALLISDLSPAHISASINRLLDSPGLQKELRANCSSARLVYNWNEEERKLLRFYGELFT